jgi:serine phosphatase RsbU (regulator of sigma subunit)/pSer/pThr/pTyr-binding forkhead associated (FHA) protein
MSVPSRVDFLTLEPCNGPALEPIRVMPDRSTVIGRAEDCRVVLQDPHVSRYHAHLAVTNSEWVLTDLGSRHGTYLNDIRLDPDLPVVIEPGDYVRIEPFVFRLVQPGTSSVRVAVEDAPVLTTSIISEPSAEELRALPEKRLELLMQGAASIQQAASETEMAEAILDLTIEGTGFTRGAVLRSTGHGGDGEVVAWRDAGDRPRSSVSYSRYLVQEASTGRVVRLCRTERDPLSVSISELGIHSAVCCPIMLGEVVTSMIYLDSRVTEPSCYPDAASFCHAVARLAGLSLSAIRRGELERRQARLERDLHLARRVQQMLGPPASGQVGKIRYATVLEPGRFVAGDLLDIFENRDGKVVICCGDVAGQGFGAGILMSAVMSHVRSGAGAGGDPTSAVTSLNQYLSLCTPSNTFVTLFVGIYDAEQGRLSYVDAGHGHWLLRRRGEAPQRGELPEGPPVGIDESFVYTSRTLDLSVGDRLIVFSDGLIEQRGGQNRAFGRERLMEAIRNAISPEEDVEQAVAAMERFVGLSTLEDDTSIASLEIQG